MIKQSVLDIKEIGPSIWKLGARFLEKLCLPRPNLRMTLNSVIQLLAQRLINVLWGQMEMRIDSIRWEVSD